MARKSLTERTQKLRDSKGGLVGDGVSDGFVGVGVCVVVAVKVGEGVPVALAVAVKGSGVKVDVEEETGVGVGGGVSVSGLKRKASRMIMVKATEVAILHRNDCNTILLIFGIITISISSSRRFSPGEPLGGVNDEIKEDLCTVSSK